MLFFTKNNLTYKLYYRQLRFIIYHKKKITQLIGFSLCFTEKNSRKKKSFGHKR